MNIYTFVAAGFFILFFILFIYFTRRKNSFEDFSVGGRGFGAVLLFMSVSATYIGPGFTLGLTSQGYSGGFFYFFMVLGYAIQIFLVGMFVAPQLRKKFTTGTYSIGDIIGGELSHNNRGLKLFSGILALGLILGFAMVMSSAAASMLSFFFGLSTSLSVVIFTGIVLLYSFSGGMRASIYADSFQFAVFSIILPVLTFFLFFDQNLSLANVSSRVVELTSYSFANTSIVGIIGLVLSFTLGELLVPPLIGRILAAKSPKSSKKSFTYSSFFLVFWIALMLLIGVLGTFSFSGEASDTTLLELGKRFLPSGLYGIFLVAMLGVVMSTLDSLLNYGSTLFTRDIFGFLYPKTLTNETRQLNISKVATVIIAIITGIFSVFVPSVLEGLLLCYTLWVPTVLVTLVASVYLEKPSARGAYLSMSIGLVVSALWHFTFLQDLFPTIIVGLAASFLGYLFGYKLRKL